MFCQVGISQNTSDGDSENDGNKVRDLFADDENRDNDKEKDKKLLINQI